MNKDTFIFLLFINITSFFLCFFDKQLAIKRKYRISEKILLGTCLIGGVFGFLISSRVFRHKTKHKKLLRIVYFMSIIWFMILVYIFI